MCMHAYYIHTPYTTYVLLTCTYIYVHIYTYMHTHTCTYRMYKHTHTHTHTHKHIPLLSSKGGPPMKTDTVSSWIKRKKDHKKNSGNQHEKKTCTKVHSTSVDPQKNWHNIIIVHPKVLESAPLEYSQMCYDNKLNLFKPALHHTNMRMIESMHVRANYMFVHAR